MKCSDCNNDLTEDELNHHAADHPGRCCDCFDVSCGITREELARSKAMGMAKRQRRHQP